ncbi:hypothetical protein EV195_10591 [Tenacibaculum skagerrakense]|uniref:YD repeat-containing protein n=1 Tax=Tenacibaculum skagerrakense TaxID=186571 RepID=A0A4R2NS16_9FLAO|nr:RHS repeat protein [Tenacibaculum skagerrakense]TCP24660.1 hypothetical protein EV195_10591 [Tenacibaculum skagerrakense]
MIKNLLEKIVIIGILILSTSKLIAQGPIAPEAGTFEPLDATDMVNLLTGDLSYVLPLMEVPSPEGGYPITLNYHAGISLDQDASWVGLGWNINPGAINRNIIGVPDDWNDALNSSISRSVGGTVRNTQIFAGVGWGDDDSNSIGLHANIQSHKAFGGETSYDYSIGIQANIAGQRYGASYASNGSWGIDYNSLSYSSKSGLGLNLSLPIMENEVYADLSLSAKGGLGISLRSPGNGSVNLTGNEGGNSGTAVSATSRDYGDMFSVNLNLGFLKIGAKTQEYDYWHFDEKTYGSTGALYVGKMGQTLDNKILPRFHQFDASQSLDEFNRVIEATQNNLTYMSYDQYNVNGQGISGSISPYLFDSGFLHLPASYYILRKTNLYGQNTELTHQFYDIPEYYKNSISKSIDNSEGSSSISFYFNNEYSSYARFKPSGNSSWTNEDNNREGKIIESIRIEGETDESEGFYSRKNRLKRGSYIETYTNKQLLGNTFYNRGIDRTKLEEDGIGAFKITKSDGVTYHYAIPVYQKEKISRVTQYDENINDKYTEEQTLTPYATHWLLTAITGPDYFDKNNNGLLDEDDYGYWVQFDYGKWSDGFAWRIPKRGYNYGEGSKSFSWGLKEVYYLNSIKTRTHTALFVKGNRLDAKSTATNHYNSTRNGLRYYEAQYNTLDQNLPRYGGVDGKTYYPGVYSTIAPEDLAEYWTTYSIINIKNGMYAQSFSQESLKLKKIILLKNEDIPTSLTTHSDGKLASKLVSDIFFTERTIIVNDGPGSDDWNSGWMDYVDSKHYGEYYHKLYDEHDSYFNIEEKAIKIIDFDYDYSLAKGYDNTGRLTLKNVNVRGKGGAKTIPPYTFNYEQNNIPYQNNDNQNSWGHYKNSPSIWSLNKITTPVGAQINVEYESDDYSSEAALKRIFFDKNLEIKFDENGNGEKLVKFRNAVDNDARQNIVFSDYFKLGKSEYLDFIYWQNDYIVDIAAECEVTNVVNNEVVFKLPNLNTKTDVRKDYTCSEKSWVFIKNYQGAIDRTLNWKEELNVNQCDSRGERIKIRLSSSLQRENVKGGGVRVKKIDINGKYPTQYFYSKNNLYESTDSNYKSSGVTSFAPSKQFKEIPFKEHVSSPIVMYENVAVLKDDGTIKKYKFNVLKPFTIQGNNYKLGNFLEVTKSNPIMQDIPRHYINDYRFYSGYTINKQNFEVKSNFGSLGALISSQITNNKGQLLSKTENKFKSLTDSDIGVIQENFSNVEEILGYYNSNTGVAINIGNTTKLSYPSVIESTSQTSGGLTTTMMYDKFDLTTGEPLETIVYDSEGRKIKTERVPANYGYREMGSKVEDYNYKNMLSQNAAEYVSVYKNGFWKPFAANVITWKNNWDYSFIDGSVTNNNDTWRKHKAYIWNGEIDQNGTYLNFNTFQFSDTAMNENWLEISEVKRYNQFSQPLEVKDINNNYVSKKLGDNYTKVITKANAAYDDMYYSGAEYQYGNYFDSRISSNGVKYVGEKEAHTGDYVVEVYPQSGFNIQVPARNGRNTSLKQRFKVSVWVKKGGENSVLIYLNNNQRIPFKTEENVFAGDWVLLNGYINIDELGASVGIVSTEPVVLDDFRLYPAISSMTSYVYNKWDEVTHIIGANGLATHYIYDESGRLIETQTELADKVPGDGSGGFKRTSTNSYNYKRNNQ